MNFVFISPQFPQSYWNFCDRLKARGVNVLGIGDTAYDALSPELRACLTEYYRVDSLEDYDQVYRAMAFLTFKHGRIDWVESNNEYWLSQDARLRDDFNIKTGMSRAEVANVRRKSAMKKFYQAAGVPAARWHIISNLEDGMKFAHEVGYYRHCYDERHGNIRHESAYQPAAHLVARRAEHLAYGYLPRALLYEVCRHCHQSEHGDDDGYGGEQRYDLCRADFLFKISLHLFVYERV